MKRKIWIISTAFIISFLVVSVLAYQAIRQFGTMVHYSNQIDNAQYSLEHLNRLESLIKDLDRYERGYMITRDSQYYFDQLRRTNGFINEQANTLRQLLGNDTLSQNTLTWIRSSMTLRAYYLKHNLEFIDTSRTAGKISDEFTMGKKMTNEALGQIDQMREREFKKLSERFKNRQIYQSTASSNLKYLFVVFSILTLVLFVILLTEVLRRLRYQDELQLKLIELSRSHSELEQIAFAASHDLQEPLRKIRIFSDRLMWMQKEKLNEEQIQTFDRISASANRMQDLIDDLVNFTSLAREADEPVTVVNLNHTLAEVREELYEKIKTEDAVISVAQLPDVQGHAKQLHLLFKSLLDNSLKFIRNGIVPVVKVYGEEVSGEELKDISPRLRDKKFLMIAVADNGIGFDNKFSTKIFRLFQRLHSRESGYSGKGIGLALCQRIMLNHKGYIIAQGKPQHGAIFKVFFPLES